MHPQITPRSPPLFNFGFKEAAASSFLHPRRSPPPRVAPGLPEIFETQARSARCLLRLLQLRPDAPTSLALAHCRSLRPGPLYPLFFSTSLDLSLFWGAPSLPLFSQRSAPKSLCRRLSSLGPGEPGTRWRAAAQSAAACRRVPIGSRRSRLGRGFRAGGTERASPTFGPAAVPQRPRGRRGADARAEGRVRDVVGAGPALRGQKVALGAVASPGPGA